MKAIVREPTDDEKTEAESWPVWEKEPSEFPWEYTDRERFLVIEGQATVSCDDGDVSFGAGDFVEMPKGLRCTWKIKEKIKKHYDFG